MTINLNEDYHITKFCAPAAFESIPLVAERMY
jgi:hypothetical protein